MNNEKKVIGAYSLKDLEKVFSIDINDNITIDEIDNLKYLKNFTVINMYSNNVDKISKILNVLKDAGKTNLITIFIDRNNKKEITRFFIDNISYNNIYIRSDDSIERIKLETFLKNENLLYDMIKPAINLSPFERFIYAYNIVKMFKKYKNSKDFADSKILYNLLNSEYIVCKGFINLFSDLLSKLNIKNVDLNFGVDSSYIDEDLYGIDFKEVKPVNVDGHSRVYVHLIDKKYDINGFYVSDPTWDNNLEKDYYNHMIMTDDEATNNSDYLWLDLEKRNIFTGESYFDIFNVNNIEEYIVKMKYIKDKNYDVFLNVVKYILNVIKTLDENVYSIIINHYNVDVFNLESISNITSLVYDLGDYIISKVNKKVDGITIFKGVEEIYKSCYGYNEEDLYSVLEEVREYNKNRQYYSFPKRYKIAKNETKEVIMNEYNKFDFKLDEKSIHKC